MKPLISKGWGALTPATWKELYGAVQSVQPTDRTGEIPIVDRFVATIDGSTIFTAGTAKWKYAWTEKKRADATTSSLSSTTNPRQGTSSTGFAVNLLELANTSILAYGFAVTSLELNDADGFYIGAVPTGTPVEMIMRRATDGAISYEFIAPNRIFGSCTGGVAQELDGGEYGA
jgi:hypothetical protein